MGKHPSNGTGENRSPLFFFVLVILFSIPFWTVGPLAERFLPEALTASLPVSALMACAPIVAAVLLTWREGGAGAVKGLLRRSLDHKRISRKAWYVPILFFWPALMVLQYALLSLVQGPLPVPQVPVLMVLGSFAVFFMGAVGEEVGWQGYAIDPLQERWKALRASLLLGSVWAVWHIIPMIQLNRAPAWIVWQGVSMVLARIVIVWLYDNTGKAVLAAILFHAMNNVTTVLLASYGWPYEPLLAVVVLALAAAAITFLWGPETLARYRYARKDSNLPENPAVETLGVSERPQRLV